MAKDKNIYWAEKKVDEIGQMIKQIEFQRTIDENGKLIDFKYLENEGNFLKLGFKPEEGFVNSRGQVAFSKHYMTHYSLGAIDLMRRIEVEIDNRHLSIDKQLEIDIKNFGDQVANVAKSRSPIRNELYDNDPYMWLNRYTSEVGIFNYKTHLKSAFKEAIEAIQHGHLESARRAGNKNVMAASKNMMEPRLMTGLYTRGDCSLKSDNTETRTEALINSNQSGATKR